MSEGNSRLKPVIEIIDDMDKHRTHEARSALKKMIEGGKPPISEKTLRRLLSMCAHHSLKVFLVSVPLAVFWYVVVSSGIVGLKIWVGSQWGSEAVTLVAFFDALVPTAAYFSIRSARDRFPTRCRPEMPWAVLVVFAVALAAILLLSHWLIVAVAVGLATADVWNLQFLVSHLEITTSGWHVGQGTLRYAMANPLMAIATLATTTLGYYGPVSPMTAQAIGLYNEAVSNR